MTDEYGGDVSVPQIQVHSVDKWVYTTMRQKEEDGKTLVCDKRDRAITYVFCRDLNLS